MSSCGGSNYPLHMTELPQGPWQSIEIDFMGPLPSGKYVFALTDYYSRYVEVSIKEKHGRCGHARNRGHFAAMINCQRNLIFKMADKSYRSQGRCIPYHILNNLRKLYGRPVSSVGGAPDCRAGGRGSKPRPDQHSG